MSLEVIYVNGLARSGTTLLMSLLRGFKNVAYIEDYPYEVRLASYLATVMRFFDEDCSVDDPWQFEQVIDRGMLAQFPFRGYKDADEWYLKLFQKDLKNLLKNGLLELALGQVRAKGSCADDVYWVEKFPHNHESEILNIFGNFSLIYLIRNPVDVAISRYIETRCNPDWAHLPQNDLHQTLIEEMVKARDLYDSYKCFEGDAKRKSLMFRYEDLISNVEIFYSEVSNAFRLELDFAKKSIVIDELAALKDRHSGKRYASTLEVSRDEALAILSVSEREMLAGIGY